MCYPGMASVRHKFRSTPVGVCRCVRNSQQGMPSNQLVGNSSCGQWRINSSTEYSGISPHDKAPCFILTLLPTVLNWKDLKFPLWRWIGKKVLCSQKSEFKTQHTSCLYTTPNGCSTIVFEARRQRGEIHIPEQGAVSLIAHITSSHAHRIARSCLPNQGKSKR